MFARLRRTILVLTIIIVAYTAYSVAVVPFIEPSVKLSNKRGPAAQAAPRVSRFTDLFPPGSWELGRPKEIETEQGTLLFADYKPLADGRMELTQCTIIARLDDSAGSAEGTEKSESNGRAIIIRAPQGASLKFDRELNLLRGDFGRLEGGEFIGEVSITSPASSPGADDALHLVTKGVQIDSEKIWTPHEVRFQYGPNNGVGRVLTIHMHSSRKSQQAELAIGGVRLLELQYLDHLDLLLPDQGLFGRQNSAAENSGSVAKVPATPVQVKCRGPMKFDFLKQLLTLEDQVDLVRQHPGGVRDQLTCDLLQIFFSGKGTAAAASAKSKDTFKELSPTKLTPIRVVATGRPVTIRAAAVGIGAKAERIEYDCVLQRVWLQDHNKVLMNDRQREVEAKELQYTLGEGNRLGELWAQGPGILRGEFGKNATAFDVSWRNEVRLKRIANEPVLSFDAHARFTVAGFGQFAGDTLHFYLREIPRSGSDDVEVVPDRLHAVGHVEIDTESCHGNMQEAKIWFKRPPDANAVSAAAYESDEPAGMLTQPQGPSARPKSKFDLRAETVEAVIRMGKKPTADLVIIRGNVELRELGVKSEPLVIQGEHFELQDGASDHPRAALLGSPAEISARGATARGSKIHLHPADNYLEIVGAGDLSLPGNSQDPATGAPTGISWAQQMQFDGQLARFEKDAVVRGTQRARNGDKTTFVAMGDLVHAELSQRIDFRSVNLQAPIELVEAAFEGWAFLQTEMFEPNGGRKLFEQMQVHGLTVNQMTGDVHGRGPGWVRGIHRGQSPLTGDPVSGAAPANNTGSELNFLRVDFERELAGNLRQQRLEFRNGTKVLYGPVNNWEDALDQEQSEARPGMMQMTCDWLGITQKNDGSANTVELEAVGNAHIHGDLFSATGGRVSYAQAKDQLILEGDGRNDARLEYQADRERPPDQMAAAKILYHPKTRQFQLVDLKQSELYDLGQFRGRNAPMVRPR